MTENLPCGCSITFREDGQVGGVSFCEAHDGIVFSEHKSLKQLALDLHHQTFQDKLPKKVVAEKKVEEPPVAEDQK